MFVSSGHGIAVLTTELEMVLPRADVDHAGYITFTSYGRNVEGVAWVDLALESVDC